MVDWETSYKIRNVEVVTTSWINSNYTGYDLAEKIRNFLRDKYPEEEWGIEDVLLVGHYDSVPMRRAWQDMGYGMPETDYYYAELSLPDDQSWDADGDHKWGEDSDPIDFYTEINVGRIPWSDAATVQAICEKSAAYEANEDPAFKKNILLLGAYFWSDTDNAVLMEAKVDQPWMGDWTMTRMYEQNSGYYSSYPCDYPLLHSNVMNVWPSGSFGFVDWAGHGSPTSAHIYGLGQPAFISSSDCPYLNDAYPAIIFADACSNSDTDYLNIGQAMLQQGSIGFLGATKVAYGMHAWDDPMDGSSQSLDYFFTTSVTSGDYSQGAAQQWGLRQMYLYGLWYYQKFETFEWGALWGNPDLGMGPLPLMRIMLPDGAPDLLTPAEPTEITVRIVEGSEQYVPDSGLAYYQYDGGDFQSVPLVHVSDDLYLATLPAAQCGDTPRFYFRAEGSSTGVIYEPAEAPGETYNATVGYVLWSEDFETEQGWTVENTDVLSGGWERGVPVSDGSRGDPTNDYDGSGQCFVTGNDTGDADVDGGPTILLSPPIDLSWTSDPEIRYARWFTCDDGEPPAKDYLNVEVSGNDGTTWVLVENVASASGWVERSFRVADYVTPTAEVRVRFTARDNPNNSITEAGIDGFRVTEPECIAWGDGDYDEDGDVDLADFRMFQTCFGESPVSELCWPGNLNGDAVIDLADYAALYPKLLAFGPQ
jgi:hypothetical protein